MQNPKHWVSDAEVSCLQAAYVGCDGEVNSNVSPPTRVINPAASGYTGDCGTSSGTISARRADCESKHGVAYTTASITCLSAEGGNSYEWYLVTRLKDGVNWYEVWQDRDGLIWSDIIRADANGGCGNTNCLPSGMMQQPSYNYLFNWCVSSGANNVSGNPFASKDPYSYCSGTTYQQQGTSGTGLPVSLCYESIGNLWTPTWVARSKGGASLAADGIWYLPTAEDYVLARKHGVRRVLPNFAGTLLDVPWSASVRADSTGYAWLFYGDYGRLNLYGRGSYAYEARCVRLP